MRRRAAPRIEMSARAVDSFRGTFSGTGGSFSDPGVALDEILSLTGNVEPVVLRVSAAGLDDASGGSLAGDWLCVDHEPPRRIRRPEWEYSFSSRRWSERNAWLDAWELCEDGVWLAHAAAEAGVDRRLVVAASCACVRLVPWAWDEPTADALATAVAWSRGAAGDAEVAAAATELSDMADRNQTAAAAKSAAMAAVAGHRHHAAGWAANAVELSAHLLSLSDEPGAYRQARRRNRSAMADCFRSHAPTIDVLRAVLEA